MAFVARIKYKLFRVSADGLLKESNAYNDIFDSMEDAVKAACNKELYGEVILPYIDSGWVE